MLNRIKKNETELNEIKSDICDILDYEDYNDEIELYVVKYTWGLVKSNGEYTIAVRIDNEYMAHSILVGHRVIGNYIRSIRGVTYAIILRDSDFGCLVKQIIVLDNNKEGVL